MFLPNIKPGTFTGTAVLIGYLLIDDLTIDEQNALSCWLTLVADVLATNASWCQVLQDRQDKYQDMLDSYKDNEDDKDKEDTQKLDLIEKALEKMKQDIEMLKRRK